MVRSMDNLYGPVHGQSLQSGPWTIPTDRSMDYPNGPLYGLPQYRIKLMNNDLWVVITRVGEILSVKCCINITDLCFENPPNNV